MIALYLYISVHLRKSYVESELQSAWKYLFDIQNDVAKYKKKTVSCGPTEFGATVIT